MTEPKITAKATDEQLLYANILEKGMLVGLVLMFITFALYVFGIMPAAIPKGDIAGYWNQPVHDYLVAINNNFLHWDHLPTGWSWLKLIGKGDFINFIPVAILSGVTVICYLAIVPGLFRRGDKAYAIMAIAEAVILALAASGLLAVGH
ncbi:MAG: hypothetical protein JRF02_08095 [Deltaproteobacteria bacterium]|jgi:hypothetical protein|nr:hypothetical protein [Deltaproteobacteria bacterium]